MPAARMSEKVSRMKKIKQPGISGIGSTRIVAIFPPMLSGNRN
jgi:hypothetical protein